MSIFSTKEFWSTTVSKGNEEEFDNNCITIGNVDNDPNNINKICVSSMKGNLRIFEPQFGINNSENLLFEKNYSEPILQIQIGNYIMNSNQLQLGILQSKKFFVAQISNLKSSTSIKNCYDHKLKRNGHNFCRGQIGDRNYDVVFIQSIDGAISIYEQDSFINLVAFSEVIFPGQIGFINRKDSFVLTNTAYEVECYSYNTLATKKISANNPKTSSQQIYHQWKVILGELVIKMEIIYNLLNKKEECVLLSETMLNLIDESGKLTYQKKLDFEPLTFKVYNITDEKYVLNNIFDLMCMVSSTQNHVLIYKGINLVWAFKLNYAPIFIDFGEFNHIKGLICTLSDNGQLNVNYLGMEPIKNNKIIQSKQIDQEVLIKESEKLQQTIENYNKGVVAESDFSLTISAEVNDNVFYDDEPGDKIFYKDNYGKILRGQVTLEFSFDGKEANDIRVNVTMPYNVICDDPIFIISSLTQKNNVIKKTISFRVIEKYYPTFTNVDIYATYYIKEKNEKTFQSTSFSLELPLTLFLRVSNENRKDNAQYKITLNTNKSQLTIPEIFKDLTNDYVDSELVKSKQHIITFIYPNKSDVTIIVSKNAGRYRIQTNNMEAILFITNQLVRRLNEHFEYQIECSIEDPINFQNYINVINDHFNLYQKKKHDLKELEKYTILYTNIQKSLLNKYQQKNPPQLYSLDFLLKQVYKQINIQSEKIEELNNKIKLCQRDIVIWTELVIYLLKLRSKMSDEHYYILKNAFPLDNIHSNENCWEEVTVTNMCNLILFYFKKNNNLQEIREISDLEKWQKYLITLFKEILANKGFGEQSKK